MVMRVVSLLPAATEIVGALGLLEQLVGVSHECDYPEAVTAKPRITRCEIHGKDSSSHDIDRWVSEKLHQGEELYTIDEVKLRELKPDVILTQKLCDVCAPSYGSVTALAQTLPGPPRVLNLEPNCLEDIFDNIRLVADALDAKRIGAKVSETLRSRVQLVQERVANIGRRPRVAVIEWLDPVFASGHWTPELVEIAGGEEVLGQKGKDSVRKTWDDVQSAAPEILVIACCGQTAQRARQDWQGVRDRASAIGQVRVFAADGNAYFSRPGPRVVDTLEILAEIIHPERLRGAFPDRGGVRLA